MADKIVILGNGFDLRHFLPTKYDHLITILREIENYDFSDSEVSFSDLFNGSFKEKDEFFYNGILNYYDVQNIKFNSEKLKSIQDRLEMNNWFQYLKTVEDSKIETWIDFETEISRVLNIISVYFEFFNSGGYEKIRYGNVDGEKRFHIDNYSSDYFFINKIQKKILTIFNLYIDKEDGRYSILNEIFILCIEKEIQYSKEKYFFDSIYISLEEFVGIFNDYIEFIVNPFYDNFIKEKKENFIFKNEKFLFNAVTKIYSFNYTNSYQKLYIKNDSTKVDIDFLHGKSIENWDYRFENLKIVLGVDDIEDALKNNKLFQFTKYFQKLHKNTDYLFLDESIEFVNHRVSQNLEIYFWGHSLDISDKDYIKDVFYIVENTSSIIKIFYHSISGKADQLKNLLSVIKDKNIIEKLMKSQKLQFIESTFDNLFNELA